tara:strand:+ start:139 stop:381 length:243 start_codon:yes stop_codon:yes gene_type:complete
MKIISKITLLVTITLFSFTAVEARDCKNPKGFHEKLTCKLQGVSGDSKTTQTGDSSKGNGELFNKIKKLLGKKNNQVTGN